MSVGIGNTLEELAREYSAAALKVQELKTEKDTAEDRARRLGTDYENAKIALQKCSKELRARLDEIEKW